MTHAPAISLILPTRDRPAQLRDCLEGLARQTLPPEDFEVLVVFDGPDPRGTAAAAEFAARVTLRPIQAPRLGNAHAKNLALAAACAPIVLLMNDDILPAPGLLEAHLAAHDELETPALVLGHSPFTTPPLDRESVFDRLVRETSMVFFYDTMVDAQGRTTRPPGHDWGYRHAWSLNLSLRREHGAAVGGFRPAIANCCYEDVELAWRLARELRAPVLFRPGASAPHHHRYTPAAYLEREHRLGYSAFGFAVAAPECARDLFGRDLASPEERDYARAFLEHESPAEARLRPAFEALDALPAADLPAGNAARAVLDLAYGQHLLLKRLAFRRGLLSGHAGELLPGLFHPRHALAPEPGLHTPAHL